MERSTSRMTASRSSACQGSGNTIAQTSTASFSRTNRRRCSRPNGTGLAQSEVGGSARAFKGADDTRLRGAP